MSRTRTRTIIEPLNGYFVGLVKYCESIYLSRSSTEYLLRGFVILTVLSASVLRTILRTYAGGCAEGKPVSLTQGGRLLEIAKSRDKRVRSIDDDIERGTLKPYPINKALAPVNDWYSRKVEGLRLLLVITNHHLFRSPCIV